MNEQNKATVSISEEQRTLGRRELLKALTAGGGAIAASTLLSGNWARPVIEVGVLPAHAQASLLTYFSIFFSPTAAENPGPSAMKVTVQGTTAYVEANNGTSEYRIETILDTGGAPTTGSDITITDACGEIDGAGDDISWSVVNYTVGDPEITIKNSGGLGGWTVTVPLGTGTLPDLIACGEGEGPIPE